MSKQTVGTTTTSVADAAHAGGSPADLGVGLQVLLDCVLDPVFIVSTENAAIVSCNAASVRWHRSEPGALIGRRFQELFGPAEDVGEDLLERVRVQGHVFVEQTFRLHTDDVVRADLAASMLNSASGSFIVVCLRDAEPRLQALRCEVEARTSADRLETIADVLRRLREEQGERMPTPKATDDAVARAAGRVPADRRRIMVADDNHAIRYTLGLLLRTACPGVQVDLAADGEEAVALFKRYHPALLVLDIMMPKQTGDAAFVEIEAHCTAQGWEEPRVVFCTGYVAPGSLAAQLEHSDRHTCLLKPVAPDTVVQVVQRFMAELRGLAPAGGRRL